MKRSGIARPVGKLGQYLGNLVLGERHQCECEMNRGRIKNRSFDFQISWQDSVSDSAIARTFRRGVEGCSYILRKGTAFAPGR